MDFICVPQLFGFLSTVHLVIVAFVVLLLFGSRLPGVMRNLGQGVTEFKKGLNGEEDAAKVEKKDE